MHLDVYVEEKLFPIDVPEVVAEQGEEFFSKMDADMDRGWQMSREWVDEPTAVDRCRIAADRLLDALETDNRDLAVLMAGYILSRQPGTSAVRIATNGEIHETELLQGGE